MIPNHEGETGSDSDPDNDRVQCYHDIVSDKVLCIHANINGARHVYIYIDDQMQIHVTDIL